MFELPCGQICRPWRICMYELRRRKVQSWHRREFLYKLRCGNFFDDYWRRRCFCVRELRIGYLFRGCGLRLLGLRRREVPNGHRRDKLYCVRCGHVLGFGGRMVHELFCWDLSDSNRCD